MLINIDVPAWNVLTCFAFGGVGYRNSRSTTERPICHFPTGEEKGTDEEPDEGDGREEWGPDSSPEPSSSDSDTDTSTSSDSSSD